MVKKGKTTSAKAGVKVGIKDPGLTHVKEKKPTGKPPKHVKMLMSLASQHGSWEKGKTYSVPDQVPVDSARRWVRSGAAKKVD